MDFFLYKFIYLLFIYFWPRWVFIAGHGPSLVAASRGLLFIAVREFLIAVASLCCGAWVLGAQASVAVAHRLSSCGLWAPECRLSSCGAQA